MNNNPTYNEEKAAVAAKVVESVHSLLVLGSLIQSNDIERVLSAFCGVLQKTEAQLVVAGPVNSLPKWLKEIENHGRVAQHQMLLLLLPSSSSISSALLLLSSFFFVLDVTQHTT